MNWTEDAAMLVLESGTTTSQKKRIGPAPSMRAASCSSDRQEELAEEERSGGRGDERQREAHVGIDHAEVGHHKVGMMRTSTGSISVTKIIQKKNCSSGKRK